MAQGFPAVCVYPPVLTVFTGLPLDTDLVFAWRQHWGLSHCCLPHGSQPVSKVNNTVLYPGKFLRESILNVRTKKKVIVSQYIHVSNPHVVHLKLTQYVNYILIKLWGEFLSPECLSHLLENSSSNGQFIQNPFL